MSAETVPKRQLAAVFHEIEGPVGVEEIDVPEPGPEDILVKVLYSGVCHSDLHIWMGDFPVKPSGLTVGGHEGAGVVVKIGSHVTNFKVGDRAGIKWINGTCQCCTMCKGGHETNCTTVIYSSINRAGTFQQYALSKATDAAFIAPHLNMAKVAPLLCAGVTVYKALKVANAQAGNIVAINGAGGGLGSLAIQYAKAMGFRVLAIDFGEEKEKHCKNLGAEFYVDVGKTKDLVETIVNLTNGGPHSVINLATAEKPIQQAAEYVRTCGTVVLVSLPKDAHLKSDVFWTVFRKITIKGSYVGSRQDTDEALDFFARGLVDVPIAIEPLKNLPSVYERMLKGQIAGRIVLDLWK